MALYIEVPRAFKPGDKIGAHPGTIAVENDRLHLVHVKGEGVTKEDEKKQRYGDGHPKASPIPQDLDHLLLGDCFHPSKLHAALETSALSLFLSSSLTKATKTSSREGIVLEILLKGIPCESRTLFTSSVTAMSLSTMR